ncbi:MAG: zinc finger CCCH domain-containing protein, partial [Deltaproteobacteria bacterium]|nr:zinc finger CCCH domain-containing protein [Deltaproteobacteria bacterium]
MGEGVQRTLGPCFAFSKGNCYMGSNCVFAHRPLTVPEAVAKGQWMGRYRAKGWGQGGGAVGGQGGKGEGVAMKGPGGGFAGKGREVCRAYQQGGCRFGDRCRYVHEEPAAPAEVEREKEDGQSEARETAEKWEYESPVWSLFESQAAEEEEKERETSRLCSDPMDEAVDNDEEVSFAGQKWEKPAVIPRSRRWVMDTGSPHDLIARDEVTGDDESAVTREFVLRTANGPAQVKTRVRSRIPGMTPAVLSIGRRVMENGYG